MQINHTADDGYKSQCGYRSGKGAPVYGDATKPEGALLAGLERTGQACGTVWLQVQARKGHEGAFSRVAEWRAQRGSLTLN